MLAQIAQDGRGDRDEGRRDHRPDDPGERRTGRHAEQDRQWMGVHRPPDHERLEDVAFELLDGDVVHVPKRPGEPDCTWADISKIRQHLDWAPQVSFEEGVGVMLQNIEYWRSAPVWNPDMIRAATETWFAMLAG